MAVADAGHLDCCRIIRPRGSLQSDAHDHQAGVDFHHSEGRLQANRLDSQTLLAVDLDSAVVGRSHIVVEVGIVGCAVQIDLRTTAVGCIVVERQGLAGRRSFGVGELGRCRMAVGADAAAFRLSMVVDAGAGRACRVAMVGLGKVCWRRMEVGTRLEELGRYNHRSYYQRTSIHSSVETSYIVLVQRFSVKVSRGAYLAM